MPFDVAAGDLNRSCRLSVAFFIHLLPLQTDLSQGAHTREVVSSHREHEHLVHALKPAHHHLANPTHLFGPAKDNAPAGGMGGIGGMGM